MKIATFAKPETVMPNFMEPLQSDRHLASNLAHSLVKEQITFHEFLKEYPDDTNDKDIEELFSLIEHQPKQGGLFGVNQGRYNSYMAEIRQLIDKLRK
ncbi:MAG: hypothetical protein IPM42_21665 [Saprospiraceae bacterium]|nr:hypothetical protein [Saprospiraceae bacterium]